MAAALSYITRDKESIKLYDFDGTKEEASVERKVAPFPLPTPKAALWSPDGSALALVDPTRGAQVVAFGPDGQGTNIYSLSSASKSTQGFLWSPKSTFVVSVAPGQKGSTEPNLHVWRRGASFEDEYTLEASFLHPKLEKGAKVMQWDPEEALCARLLPDGRVYIQRGNDLAGEPLETLKLGQNIQSFEFSPCRAGGSLAARLAVFVPDARDDMQRVVGPAHVHIFEFSLEGDGVKCVEKVKTPVAAGQVAELLWNHSGSALIAHCQTEVDETGLSYYGGSKLYLISSDGECQKDLMDSANGLVSNGGIVQAVAWSPCRDEFILIHGFQPSRATLFSWDDRTKQVAAAKVLLEKAHRNTIRFNHFGSLVCLAGFGNLAGQVDFFGRADDAENEKVDFVKVASCTANCTVSAEWAPDGRHFITSVLAPRMRVDNQASIWRGLTGTLVAATKYEELYDVQWRPEPPGSLRFLDIGSEEIEEASKDSTDKLGAAVAAKAYRPPKARGEGSNMVAAMMRGDIAAPDADRRKRQPRQQKARDEENNPSPRHDEEGRERGDRDRERRHSGDAGNPEGGPTPSHPPPTQSPQQQLRDRDREREREQREQQQHREQQQQREQQQREQQQQQAREREQREQQAQQQERERREQRERDHQMELLAKAYQQQQQQGHRGGMPPQGPPQGSAEAQREHLQELATLREIERLRMQQQQQQQRQQQQQLLGQTAAHAQHPQVANRQAEAQVLQALARLNAPGGPYPPTAATAAYHQQQQQQQQQQQHQERMRQAALLQERQMQELRAQQQAEQQRRNQQVAQQQQQQQHQQGGINHGPKKAPPQGGWEYIDPKGNIQGPFSLAEMQQWNQMGYFRADLPMRCDKNDKFIPFATLWKHPLVPFQSYPNRPIAGPGYMP